MSHDAPPGAPAPTFDDLYRQRASSVLRALRRYGVAERDCEDAMQDVFLVVRRDLPKYEPRGPVMAWLLGIARFVAMHRRKRQDRMPLVADVPGLEDEIAKMEHESQLDQERRAIMRNLLLRVLDSVDSERRDVFVMHELEGMSVEEIAADRSIPVGTAATRLRLARRDIEAILKRLKAGERGGGSGLGSLSLAMLLEAEREIPPLPPGMSDRVLARLRATPEAPVPGPSPESGPVRDLAAGAVKHGAALLSRRAAGFGGALLFAAGIAIGAIWHPLQRSPPPPSATQTATIAPAPQETMSPAPTAAASASAEVAPDAGTVARVPDDEGEERTLMRKASGALASGDAAGALAAVEEHARRFRNGGRHAEEREGYRILALVSAGRRGEAKDRFERFARSYPASTRLDALRGAIDDGAGPR